MGRKIQIVLCDEAWNVLENVTDESNNSFKNGSITYSDVVSEYLQSGKIDIRLLQAKHTNIRKSLRLMASQKEIDLDSAIKSLMDLKSRAAKRPSRTAASEGNS